MQVVEEYIYHSHCLVKSRLQRSGASAMTAAVLRMNSSVRLMCVLQWRRKASTMADVGMSSSHIEPRPFSEIPGPRSWPLLGTFPSIYFDPAYDASRLPRLWESYFKRYGPIFKLNVVGLGNILFLSDIQDFEKVFKETAQNPVRPYFHTLKKIREMKGEDYFKKSGGGILTEHGEEWRRVRSRVQTHTMKPRTVAQYLPQMDRVARQFIARTAGQRDQKDELPEDFLSELYKWAMESLSLVSFGRQIGCLDDSEEGVRMIEASINYMHSSHDCEYNTQWWRFFTTPTLRRMQESHDTLLEASMAAVRKTEASLKGRTFKEEEKEGLLTLLESLVMTPGLTFHDVVTFITDILIAGVDTTSLSVLFVMYNLARNPDKQAKMQQELDQVLGDGTEVLNEKHLAKLSYTKACVKESLRLYTPVPVFSRELTNDMILQGYTVPCGTTVFLNMNASGMNEEYFPRATEFIPERWLRDSNFGRINSFASLPFSTGTRTCVGRRLSEQEMYTLLSRFFLKYSLDYKYEAWDPVFKFLVEPDKPQKFTMRER